MIEAGEQLGKMREVVMTEYDRAGKYLFMT